MKVINTKNVPKLKNGIHIQFSKNHVFILIYKNNVLHNTNSFAYFEKKYGKCTRYYYIDGKFVTDCKMSNARWKSIAKEIIRSNKLKVFL